MLLVVLPTLVVVCRRKIYPTNACFQLFIMEYILDFQGYKGSTNKFIIKELVIVSTDGLYYQLHLFKPPCSFGELTPQTRKQIVWLEKYFHHISWKVGYKDYVEIPDVLRTIQLNGIVYVKGCEKQIFLSELLKDTQITILNLEDKGCPSFDILRQQSCLGQSISPCCFDHFTSNCAYNNVYLLLEWWKVEKRVLDKLDLVNKAIGEYFVKGLRNMSDEMVKIIPKELLINVKEDLAPIYYKLPTQIKQDEEIIKKLWAATNEDKTRKSE